MSFDILYNEEKNEIKIYDIDKINWHIETEKINCLVSPSCPKLINTLDEDITVLIPLDNGSDFLITLVSDYFLEINQIHNKDIVGKSLKKSFPYLKEHFYELFTETYISKKPKIINLQLYKNNNIINTYQLDLISDNNELYIITKKKETTSNKKTDISIQKIINKPDKFRQLEISNNDKNKLLKEVHHRVKNNLQILNSFLSLEERFHKNDSDIINNTKNRLKSLALMHEKAYDGETIKMKDYLNEFDLKLFNNLNLDNKFIIDVDSKAQLPLDLVTPLTLIINELTVNSIKYAFTNNQTDKIIYKYLKIIDKQCKFIYRDNGIGLPKNFDIDNISSLGWIIINSLIKQLDGELIVKNEKGMYFELTFPIKSNT